jgi:archaellum component FlaC
VKELKDCKLAADDVFSEYPVLIYGDKLIQKHNIGAFLKQMTTIDDKFNDSDLNSHGINERLQIERDSIERLSTMVQTQLHLITVSLLPCS